MYIAEWTIDRH